MLDELKGRVSHQLLAFLHTGNTQALAARWNNLLDTNLTTEHSEGGTHLSDDVKN